MFAYNHADWYVDSVLLRAQVIGGLPSNLVGSLTGLTQGRFPIQAKATYAGQLERTRKRMRQGNAAMVVEPTGRRGIRIFSRDGRAGDRRQRRADREDRRVRKRLGRFVVLQDVYGNTYTYGHLGPRRQALPVAEAAGLSTEDDIKREMKLPARDAAPDQRGVGDRPAREPRARSASWPSAPLPTAARPPRPKPAARAPRSDCSPTRRGRTPRPPAAPSRSSSAPA